jgi:hypothetical protein
MAGCPVQAFSSATKPYAFFFMAVKEDKQTIENLLFTRIYKTAIYKTIV